METKEILERVKADGVKFVSYQFTDVTGTVKSVDAPVQRLEEACQAYDEPAIMQLIRELVPEMQAPAKSQSDNVIPFEAKSKS